jgi:hypothetical protein
MLDKTQDDLAAGMIYGAELVGTARFRQRQNSFDNGEVQSWGQRF